MEQTAAISDALRAGARVGGYTIREVLSRDDTRTIFLADEEGAERTVALEVLSGAQLGPTDLARFRYEVHALTSLRHPRIAQVHETGIHVIEDGEDLYEIPWFAMEDVGAARPVTDYVEARGLGRDERLRLFVEVCDAVQHGHQKGVVHGGLAADQILVDDEGRAKVIEFGIARVLEPGGDVRDDVHALGRVLQTLLGEAPKGDLGAILASALEDDETKRYASANALAADLRRFLEHRPVEARAASPIYPMRLWTRRHRIITAGIALLVTLSLVAAAVATVYAVRKHQEAESLRKELDAIKGE